MDLTVSFMLVLMSVSSVSLLRVSVSKYKQRGSATQCVHYYGASLYHYTLITT